MRKVNVRKKMHRAINRTIREVNKNIENDNLWKGRFVLREKRYYDGEYEDKSGWHASAIIRIYDKLTGLYRDEIFDDYHLTNNTWNLFWFVNNFIVEDVKVWEENPSPRDKDWAKDLDYSKMPLRAITNVRGYSIIGHGN